MDPGIFSLHLNDFAYAFLSVLLEGMPFILLGTVISGILDQFLPSRAMVKWLPSHPVWAIALCGGMGILFPMCECGIVPVIRRLINKGLPLACGLTYMLAAPVVNLIVAFSTFAAFRGQSPLEMTLLRVGVAYLVAILVGLALNSIRPERILRSGVLAKSGSHEHEAGGGLLLRLHAAAKVAVGDFLDVMTFFVSGVAISAAVSTGLNQEVILPLALNTGLATAAMMVMAFILSLCSTSDAFIAATFVSFPPVAKLAFLVLGPMLDLKLIFLYSSIFRKSFVAILSLSLFVGIWIICVRLAFLPL